MNGNIRITCIAVLVLPWVCVAAMQENASVWTTNDTEVVWAGIIDTATRTTTAPRFKNADAEAGEGKL